MNAKPLPEQIDDIIAGYSALIDKLAADNTLLRAELKLAEAQRDKLKNLLEKTL